MDKAPLIRKNLFKEIHEIAFSGKGGYNFDIVYKLPTTIRRFINKELVKFYKVDDEEEENEFPDKTKLKQKIASGKLVKSKNAAPSYTSKFTNPPKG